MYRKTAMEVLNKESDTEVPTTTISESLDQEEKRSEPVLKKAMHVISEKYRGILLLG